MRSRSSWLGMGIVVGAATLSGCVLEDGDPWGLVRADLAIAFEPEAGRVVDGRLATAKDYRVEVTTFEVELGSMALVAGATSALGFDPADPPEGYTLCHNGHCHTTDGRVVSYEEIARELAGEGAAGSALATWSPETGPHLIALGAREPVSVDGCAARGCAVADPASAGVVSLQVAHVHIVGRAFDARTGANARLPAEGVAFTVDMGAIGVAAPLEESFGPSERLGLALGVTVMVPAGLFDAVDFATGEGLDADVGEALASGLRLGLEARRFD